MSKRVKISIEVDESFVRLLQASVQLKGLLSDPPSQVMDPVAVLAVIALGEMRGATEEQVHAMTPPAWRASIEAVHAERVVRVD